MCKCPVDRLGHFRHNAGRDRVRRAPSEKKGYFGYLNLDNVAPALVCTGPPPPNNFSALNQELFEGCPGMVIVLVLVLVH